MTKEDKELLLKDLSSRLPHGVKLYHADDFGDNIGKLESINISNDECVIWNYNETDTDIFDIETCKPFLRPMSSMTDEEKDYVIHLAELPCAAQICEKKVDFFLSHHIDWRGLIPKGLALEAPEGMYKEK